MAKNKEQVEVQQEVETQQTETGTEFTESEAPSVSLRDLDQLAQVIDLASQRGAFRGGELAVVGTLYNKLVAFLTNVKAQQDAQQDAQQESGAEEVAPETGEE